jgi:DNA-binding NtrC family response regulator
MPAKPRLIEFLNQLGHFRPLLDDLDRSVRCMSSSISSGCRRMTSRSLGTHNAVDGGSLADLERQTIPRTLAAVGGNRRLAATRLGIGLRTLYEKLKRYDLQ